MTSSEKRMVGFSLIEINLAIFVVGMGMLTLFSLFPSGLRQVEDSLNDTQTAMFADYVFSTLRSEARSIPAAQWAPAAFEGVIEQELNAQSYLGDPDIRRVRWGGGGDVQEYMRFRVEFGSAGNDLITASLWCQVGEFGPTGNRFITRANRFYTEFVFSGMP